MNESSSRNGDWAESTNHHVLLSWTQCWLWQPFASPLSPVSASRWWLPIYWPWLCSCCLLPILCHQLQKLYPSSPFTSVEQYLRYVNQTKFWLATIIIFKPCYTICSLDCLCLYRTFSLEGNKYVIPPSSNHLPVVILVIYIYFNCEKKLFLVATSAINTDLICVRLLHVFSS